MRRIYHSLQGAHARLRSGERISRMQPHPPRHDRGGRVKLTAWFRRRQRTSFTGHRIGHHPPDLCDRRPLCLHHARREGSQEGQDQISAVLWNLRREQPGTERDRAGSALLRGSEGYARQHRNTAPHRGEPISALCRVICCAIEHSGQGKQGVPGQVPHLYDELAPVEIVLIRQLNLVGDDHGDAADHHRLVSRWAQPPQEPLTQGTASASAAHWRQAERSTPAMCAGAPAPDRLVESKETTPWGRGRRRFS